MIDASADMLAANKSGTALLHPTALIDPQAHLAPDVQVGPYSIIGRDVRIGAGTIIGPHVVLRGPTSIGRDNRIFQFSSIGEECQDKKYRGEETGLIIGDRNIIREGATLSRGTAQGGGITQIGNDNLLMAYVHIAHDCMVGNDNVFANHASLAGHVKVGCKANLGGFAGVHQYCAIGDYSFCAGGSIVVKDVPPYMMVQGYPAQSHGLNFVGLKRRGFSEEQISLLKQVYRIFYRQGLTTDEALAILETQWPDNPDVQRFILFVRASTRSITR